MNKTMKLAFRKQVCEQQENRMRRNNMRILSLPEDKEKGDFSSYVVKLISEELGVDISQKDLEWFHRLGVKRKNTKWPHIVPQLEDYHQTKVNILKVQGERRLNSMASPFDSSRTCLLSWEKNASNSFQSDSQWRKKELSLNSASRQCCGYRKEHKRWNSQVPMKPEIGCKKPFQLKESPMPWEN